MEDAKRLYREGEQKVKEGARELDGHQPSDDIGNAGDELRKNLGNAGDDMRNADDRAMDDTPAEERRTW